MKLIAVILNFRTAGMTIEATQATLNALNAAAFDWRVIIVDNDSGDDSEEKLRQACLDHQSKNTQGWEHVEVIQSGNNGGFGAGNNVGIRYGMEKYPDLEYAYILNSDAFPEQEAISTLISFLDENPRYGIAGSRIHGTDNEPHITAFRFPSIQSELEDSIAFGPVTRLLKNYVVPMGMPEAAIDVDWLAGASMVMRTQMIKEIDLFDETFFLYFEETDLCRRASQKGWKIRYLTESRVAHIGSASTGMKKWTRIPSYWLDSRRHYFKKNHGAWYFYVATLLKLLGHSFNELRCFVTRRDSGRPEQFGRDLLKHTLNIPLGNIK